MLPPKLQRPKVDWEDFERTSSGIRAFKSRLPENSVRNLAEEVLDRIGRQGPSHENDSVHHPTADQIDHLAFALLDAEADAARNYISDAQDAGATTDEVYLAYLAGAARRLGEWWADNHVSFMDVILATSRIFGLLRALRVDDSPYIVSETPSAVFMTVPGETHNLGIQMAADLFRRQGWGIDLLIDKKHEELIEAAEAMQPAVIGISAAGEHALVGLARLILALRIHCPDALIVVSGAIVTEAEELLLDLSPDATVRDVTTAYNVLSDLWDIVQRRHALRESYKGQGT